LFEVARHSWLSDYAHVVSHVTSSTTTVGEIANTTVTAGMLYIIPGVSSAKPSGALPIYPLVIKCLIADSDIDQHDAPLLTRSASVREPSKANPTNMSPVGGLSHQGRIDPEVPTEKTKSTRDPKRRTVQVEYVAPQSQTTRGETSPTAPSPAMLTQSPIAASGGPKITRARDGTEGLEGISQQSISATANSKPVPQDPSIAQHQRQDRAYYGQPSTVQPQQRPSGTQQAMAPPSRPPKDLPRSVSDSTSAFAPMSSTMTGRPATGGSMSSGAGRLPSRGNSYSKPLAPTVAVTTAQGRLAQPKNGKQYNISAPMPQSEPYYPEQSIGRPSTQQYTPASPPPAQRDQQRGHKRSNTLGNLLGRSGSVFGGRPASQSKPEQRPQQEKRYPPTSMKAPMPSDSPRLSTDSRRPSFGFGRKTSDLRKNSDVSKQEKPRRFSLLPASFSFKGLTGGAKDQFSDTALATSEQRPTTMPQAPPSRGQPRPEPPAYSRGQNQSNSHRNESGAATGYDGQRDSDGPQTRRNNNTSSRGGSQIQQGYYNDSQTATQPEALGPPRPSQGQSYLLGESGSPSESEISVNAAQRRPMYPPGFNSYEDDARQSMQQSRNPRGASVLQKNNRKFADAYEQDQEPGYGGGGRNAGSSGAAKRVMDFFRRRGKARAGDDRV